MAHITSVRLQGFKSVSQLDVRFGRGLNVIVGANGCGKSSLLDALCFAFAAAPRSLSVASLAELQNSDSNQVCEVCVQLQTGRGTGREMHTVQAALTPDGTRAYKVNGRQRSGKEVREFLRGLGVCLDSAAAVIKQARVTSLADSASPADLAAVVAEASGLGRWNEEVSAASEELKRTRKAVVEVQASLATMEEAAAVDGEKLRAVERLHQIDHEAADMAQRMAGMLQAGVELCRSQAAAGQAATEAASARLAEARVQVDRWQGEVEDARQQLAAAQEQAGVTGGDEVLPLQQAVAAAEEEVRLLMEQQQRRHQLEAQLEQAAAAVQQLAATHSQAAVELAECQQAHCRLDAELQQAESAATLSALHASLAAEERQLAAAVAAKELAVAAAKATAMETSGRLQELQVEQQRLRNAALVAGSEPGCDDSSRQGRPQLRLKLEMEAVQQRGRLQQIQQQEQQLQVEVGMLAAQLGRTAPSSSGATWRPLHQCFSLQEPQRCQQYATALQVLAGSKLDVVVVDSLEAAGQLLAAGGGTRIWPLDSLVATDHTLQQRRATQHFPSGQVVLPVDLLHSEASYRPAVLRAFGGHVIAATDAVAEQLINRFSIPSITPDGKVTSRGTLQGGWRGPGIAVSQSPMHLKISLAAAERQLAAVQQEVASAQVVLDACQQQQLDAQQQEDAAEAASAELAAAEREVHACQLQLARQRAAHADAAAVVARMQAELAAKRQLLQSLDAEGAGGSNSGAQAALGREQQRLAVSAVALERRAQAAAAELAEAAARVAAAEDELALLQAEPAWAAVMDSRRGELASAMAALLAKQQEHCEQSAAVADRQKEGERTANQLSMAEQALDAAEVAAARLRAAAVCLEGVQRDLQQELQALLREVPELGAVVQAPQSRGDHGSSGSGTQSVDQVQQACAKLARQRVRLLQERQHISAASLPLSEQLRFREQQARLVASRQQAATLETAAQRLQEGITCANSQVLAMNEAVFRAIATTFQSLVAAVMPAYHLRLRKVGAEVHEGVRLEFAHSPAGAAAADEAPSDIADGGSGEWRTGLDALSGGQRTMVALAFTVAASMSGAATSLLLMDEVDAALDETNQALVARLFCTLSGSGNNGSGTSVSACRQVLCVSHNAAFQQLCQHVVRLTRGPAGTQLAEGSVGVAPPAAGGRSKKARNA